MTKLLSENPIMVFLTAVGTIGGIVALAMEVPDALMLGIVGTIVLALILGAIRMVLWLIDFVAEEIHEQVADDVPQPQPQLVQRVIQAVPPTTGKWSLRDEIRIPAEWRPNQAYYKQAFNELYYEELGEHGEAVRRFKNEFLQWINFQVGTHIENYPGVDRVDAEERYYVTGIELAREGKLGDENWRLIANHLRDRVLAFTAQYGNPKRGAVTS